MIHLKSRYQCVEESIETQDAINERDSLFQFLVKDNEIAFLYNLNPIDQPKLKDLPDCLAHLCGDDRYLNPQTGEVENETCHIAFCCINDALPKGFELTGDQFVDYYIDMLNFVPPQKVKTLIGTHITINI